ncbi:MAG: starch-binding protein [Muribaculaceae bacterium]|nr:starch-binding protein [Muribaculaceae bacterium]
MKFSQLLSVITPRCLLAAGAFMLMAGNMVEADATVIYMPHNLPGESDWTFDHPMTPSETEPNTWTTTLALHNCQPGTAPDTSAWFTFYNIPVTGWGATSNRFGGEANQLETTSGTVYTATINNDNCFVINRDGTYEITFKLADDEKSAAITFNRIGDYNEELDPLLPPVNPPVIDPTGKSYCYFYNSANWSEVKIWAWDDSRNYTGGTWPGVDMTLNGDGFYYWETTEGTPKQIIISNGEGVKAGGDLDFVNGAYYKVDGNYQMDPPEIVTPPIIDPDDPEDPSGNFENGKFIPKESDANYSTYFPTDKEYVFFVNEDNWDPYLYAWIKDTEIKASASWPGDQMKRYKGNVYIWQNNSEITASMLIISNNGGTKAGNKDLDFYNHATYYKDGSHKGGTIVLPPQPSDNAGAVTDWKLENGVVEMICEKASIFITPYSDKIVKVFTLPAGSTAQERKSITVVAEPDPSLSIDVVEHTSNYVISVNGTAIQIAVEKATGLLSFSETTSAGPTQKLSEYRYLDNVTHTVSLIAPEEDVAFYGGGPSSRAGSIKNQTIIMNNKQKWGWNADYNGEHNIEIPFVVSTSNYGVLFDDHYRYAKMSPSSAGITYESGSANPISYYFIGGENMDEVVANYTGLTGRQPLPPYWSLGYISSKYGYYSFDEGDQVISNIRATQIPLDGIVYDLYWQGDDEYHLGTLNWGNRFPNPSAKLSEWKNKGIHTVLITEPYFTDRCTNWSFLKNSGYLADSHVSDNDNMNWLHPNRDVGLIDASNPDAMDWMYKFYKDRTSEGVDGWWLDLGEPEGYDDDSVHKGGTPNQVHNEFGQIWVGHIHDCLTRDFGEMRHFIMPRAGTSGMQRYSAFPWTGDIHRSWSGFEAQIPSLMNMSMAGLSFVGSDVGGFACMPDGYTNAKLYLRWVQFGALSPMLRTHSKFSPEPYHDVYNSILPDVRKAINLRYRLLPYVYTLAYENSAFGFPMARPACAFDRDKYMLAENNDSYLWGRDLFVAPVLTNNDSRQITFPEGEWADMNDVLKAGTASPIEPHVYSGHSVENYSAPQDRIPFFMRKGSFIPMFTQTNENAASLTDMQFQSTSDLNYNDLTVYHYLSADTDGDHTSIMYQDDRSSRSSLETGKYLITKFTSHYVGGEGGSEGQLYNITISQEGDESVADETRTIHFYCFGYDGSDIHGLMVNLPESEPQEPQPQEARARRQPGISTLADDEDDVVERFQQYVKPSLQEAQQSDGHAIYHDKDHNMLYVKAANIPTKGDILLEMGSIPTAITDVMTSGVTISYVAGQLNYSVGNHAKEAVIEIYSADGRLLSTVTPTVFDGHVNSVEAPDADGFCIARLTARDAYGNVKTATCKYFVR